MTRIYSLRGVVAAYLFIFASACTDCAHNLTGPVVQELEFPITANSYSDNSVIYLTSALISLETVQLVSVAELEQGITISFDDAIQVYLQRADAFEALQQSISDNYVRQSRLPPIMSIQAGEIEILDRHKFLEGTTVIITIKK